jgi:hypothetical protein
MRIACEALLALFAGFVSWNAVGWALKPGLFLYMDEIGNLTRFVATPYWRMATLLPAWIYNDRPTGFILEGLLFDAFGFTYWPQALVLLLFHAANAAMGFVLFRRLGIGVPLSFAAIGLYGGLWTTAETAPYVGAVFDVTCLFFLLASLLAFLSERRGSTILSAVCFLLALRAKEFAIVLPLLLVILGLRQWSESHVLRRTWPHFLIAAVIAVRYVSFLPQAREVIGPQNPYHANPTAGTILHSLTYYTALIFGLEGTPAAKAVAPFAVVFAAVAAYGFWRRNLVLLFGLASYVLLLLPVAAIPGIRATFYVYAPQLFLILAVAALLEDWSARFLKRPQARWAAALSAGVLMLAWTLTLQRSDYFKNRTAFYLGVRKISAVSARSVETLVPALQSLPHIFVAYQGERPWLLVPGPCDYLRVITRQGAIRCFLDTSRAELEEAYEKQTGPKLLLNYEQDGTFRLLAQDSRPNGH